MRSAIAVAFGALLAAGCSQSGIDAPEPLPELDENFFRCEVQPVLAARCSFMDCHGNSERPLRIFAEQRFRLTVTWDEFETPLEDAELAANFDVARGFVATRPGDEHLLSEKPLDTRAGGLFHRGRDLYGVDDVFVSSSDPGYRALVDFAAGGTAEPDCVPVEEVGL